jgi:hypothetical protein
MRYFRIQAVFPYGGGERLGWMIYWWKYKTYVKIETGWKGKWPKDKPRLYIYRLDYCNTSWWQSGSLMLIDRRICWDTQRR